MTIDAKKLRELSEKVPKAAGWQKIDAIQELTDFLRNSVPAILSLAEENERLAEKVKQAVLDYIDGQREVDKALKEFGYDDIRFVDVRHGWMFSTSRMMKWPEVEKARDEYDQEKHAQEIAALTPAASAKGDE